MVEVDITSKNILQAMSEDCRQSMASLAKKLHCAPKTVKKKLSKLEDEYDIRYTLELDENMLGFTARYFLLFRFSRPIDEKTILKVLKKWKYPQFAALTKGDFDLVIYLLTKTHLEFVNWVNYFRQELSGYIEYWEGGMVTGYWYGFFPESEEILEDADLEDRERIMLRILIRNARAPLSDIARRLNVSVSTAQYHMNKLMNKKLIKRATIVIEKPPYPVHFVGIYGYKMTSEFMKRALAVRSFLTTEATYEPVNRLLLEFNTAATTFDDVTFYSVTDLDEGYSFQKKMVELCGPELRTHKFAFILKVLKGSLPIRKLDIAKEYRADDVKIYDYIMKD
jgi:DNA-binding Lrp family transcriptional regulator